MKSFTGCWTCRLRRKKCDEHHPKCHACRALGITCHYDDERPEWMDGGLRQGQMADQIKREVKANANRRHPIELFNDPIWVQEMSPSSSVPPLYELSDTLYSRAPVPLSAHLNIFDAKNGSSVEPRAEPTPLWSRRRDESTPPGGESGRKTALHWSEANFFMSYLENCFPFLFPFYRPPLWEGGKGWVLDLMMISPIVRQTALCQGGYFLSLAQDASRCEVAWDAVLVLTRDAFGMLRESLQAIDSKSVVEDLHEFVRLMSSIVQVQRFELAISSFENCQAHLNAAIALFRQILENLPRGKPAAKSTSDFEFVMNSLGPSSPILPTHWTLVPSPDQAAFRFTSALVILDDIVASTALQTRPKLYEYHRGLLSSIGGADPAVDLEAVVGCQNWVLLELGEVAALDAWKQSHKANGTLDIMELVHRASSIKDALVTNLAGLEVDPGLLSKHHGGLPSVFTACNGYLSYPAADQGYFVTRVWAHATLVYLFVVVSGWRPGSADVRYHIGRIIELMAHQMSPPALLRSVAWPFCVAGCLAEPAQEACLRALVATLQPPSVFGTVHKALQIMEEVWRHREGPGDVATRDLATCFRMQGDLVLLV